MQDILEKLQRFLQSCNQDASSSEYLVTNELIQNGAVLVVFRLEAYRNVELACSIQPLGISNSTSK